MKQGWQEVALEVEDAYKCMSLLLFGRLWNRGTFKCIIRYYSTLSRIPTLASGLSWCIAGDSVPILSWPYGMTPVFSGEERLPKTDQWSGGRGDNTPIPHIFTLLVFFKFFSLLPSMSFLLSHISTMFSLFPWIFSNLIISILKFQFKILIKDNSIIQLFN